MSNLQFQFVPKSYADADEFLGDEDSRKIAHNTYLVRNGNNSRIVVQYHGNNIVMFYPDGDIWASLAGWNTVTTMNRLTILLRQHGVSFCRRNWEPFIWRNGELTLIDSYTWYPVFPDFPDK